MVKTEFGIKDLENLSNVKAHTIRIWEKRYNLLEPDRTDTNIRKYNLDNLKKLLNIAYLYNAGHKISKIASLEAAQIQGLVQETIGEVDSAYLGNVFKSAMFEFDGELFDDTLNAILQKKSFRETFTEIFVPLLNQNGVLWHSGTIDPAHEHFISEKIKHAIILHTAKNKKTVPLIRAPLFALYLPLNELHEIGLLYANYEVVSAGFQSVYLGANLPTESLKHLLKTKNKIIFVTYITVTENDNWDSYIKNFQNINSGPNEAELWLLGPRAGKNLEQYKNVLFFTDHKAFVAHLTNQMIA